MHSLACSLKLEHSTLVRASMQPVSSGYEHGKCDQGRHAERLQRGCGRDGAPDRSRTCGTLLRRQVLYPLSYGGRFSEHVLALAVMSIRIIVQDRVAANKEHAD